MKTYTLYTWFRKDEGGVAICHSENFLGLHDKIGEFDTVGELMELLISHDPEMFTSHDKYEDLAYRMIEDLEYEED